MNILSNEIFHEGNERFFNWIVQENEDIGDMTAVYLFEGGGVDSDFSVGNDLLFVFLERAGALFVTVAVKTDSDSFVFLFILQWYVDTGYIECARLYPYSL